MTYNSEMKHSLHSPFRSRTILILLSCLLLLCAGLAVYAVLWLRGYAELLKEEPEVTLSPDLADVTYCTMAGEALALDLYYPTGDVPTPYPLLVYAHGGSFTGGDKRSGSGGIDIPAMNARGYAVAAVNYRLMPDHPFPAEVQDVKCAIRFLRAHAADYRLDTTRIGAWGGSAGGHLVAMLGLTIGDPAFETGEYLDQSSGVDAVVDMFGPADLTQPMGWLQRWLLRRAFGTDDISATLLHEASPVYRARPGAPPFLILHGDADSAVPLQQSKLLLRALQDAGIPASLVVVANANHNFKPTAGPIRPSRQEISMMMGDFFDKNIR